MWEQYRERILLANPALRREDTVVKIAAGKYMLYVERAFRAGQQAAAETKVAANGFRGVGNNPFADLFGGIFGGK